MGSEPPKLLRTFCEPVPPSSCTKGCALTKAFMIFSSGACFRRLSEQQNLAKLFVQNKGRTGSQNAFLIFRFFMNSRPPSLPQLKVEMRARVVEIVFHTVHAIISMCRRSGEALVGLHRMISRKHTCSFRGCSLHLHTQKPSYQTRVLRT